jgi:hypothetical protein
MNLLATVSAGTGLQKIGERPVASGEGERHFAPGDGREASGQTEGLSRLFRLSGPSRSSDQTHETNQINQIDQTNQLLLSLWQIVATKFSTEAVTVNRFAGCTS